MYGYGLKCVPQFSGLSLRLLANPTQHTSCKPVMLCYLVQPMFQVLNYTMIVHNAHICFLLASAGALKGALTAGWPEWVLPESTTLCTQVQQKVERLVAIWEERKVFGQSGTKPFTELVDAAGTPKKASGAVPPSPPL